MIGRRLEDVVVEPGAAWRWPLPYDELRPGDFWKYVGDNVRGHAGPENLTGTVWGIVCPMSYGFAIGTLSLHTVREHDDGMISVRPGDGSSNSILVTGHRGEQWHGYIEQGEWLRC